MVLSYLKNVKYPEFVLFCVYRCHERMPLHIINGDILNMDNVEYIVHQVDCLRVQSHGLSESISMKYPWADVYVQRRNIQGRHLAIAKDRDIPGTIRIFKNSNHTPYVICFFGQYDFGTPRHQQKVFDFKDSSEKNGFIRACNTSVK